MDMEWWGWLGWGVGVIGGAYGTVRSFLTARDLRASAIPWTVETTDNVNFVFTNRTPYVVRDVAIQLPPGALYGPPGQTGPMQLDGQPEVLRPNETFRANFALPFGTVGDTMTISWKSRFRPTRTFTMRIPEVASRTR